MRKDTVLAFRMGLMVFSLMGIIGISSAGATTLDEISSWAGSGSNRAALVIHWSSPEVLNRTSVPAPVADQVMVWGYRFDGTAATGADMLNAILAADPRLFATIKTTAGMGDAVLGIGYDLNDSHTFGVTNGTDVYLQDAFVGGKKSFNSYGTADVFYSADSGDLFWGGWDGPQWEAWNEQGDNGGFNSMPDRGSNPYWTPEGDISSPWGGGSQGQWTLCSSGIGGYHLKNGSWIGLTVAAGGMVYDNDWNLVAGDPGTWAGYYHKQAPVPEPASLLLLLGGLLSLMGSTRKEGSR